MVTVGLGELVADGENARTHPEENLKAITASLREFGQVEPLVVRRGTNVVVGGNGRLAAMRGLGWGEAKVVYVDLTDERAKVLGLALNRTGDLAGWDPEMLERVLAEMPADPEVDWSALGVGDKDLAAMAEEAWGARHAEEQASRTAKTPASDRLPPTEGCPVVAKGEVWELGRHRLVCGDCGDPAVVALATEGRLCDLMVTDPPYGVDYAAKNEYLNSIARGNKIQVDIEGDAATPEEMSKRWVRWFTAVRTAMRPGAAYYTTGPQGGDLLLLLLALRESGFPLRHMLIWAKNNQVLGRSDYHYKHEPIVYGWVEGAAHHAVTNRSETSLWEIDKPQSSDLHPTMKPVELYKRAIRNSSDPGETVIEPFAGSGTAFVACEELGRRCVGIEIDPGYCGIIIKRWEDMTAEKATRVAG